MNSFTGTLKLTGMSPVEYRKQTSQLSA